MIEFLVKNVHSLEEHSFQFTPYNCDAFDDIKTHGVPVFMIWERCSTFFQLSEDLAIVLLSGGRIYKDCEARLSSISSTIYLVQVDPAIFPMFHIDEVSVKASIGWLQGNEISDLSFMQTWQLSVALTDAIKAQQVEDSQRDLHRAEEPIVVEPVEVPRPGGPQIRWLRVGLIVRLALFYLVFYHERDEPIEKKAYIILGIIVVYMLQIGLFSVAYRHFLENLHDRNQQAIDNAAGVVVPANNQEANMIAHQHQLPAHRLGVLQRSLIYLEHFVQFGMALPRTDGILYDGLSLFIAFIGSLFPGWSAFQPPPQYQRA